ncbi:hypothetical protein LBMAG53_30560 [Planctomycetota bacterium]|nr:hypothetical protein LBMAG53_30560 [Planctomycetota bacterium]
MPISVAVGPAEATQLRRPADLPGCISAAERIESGKPIGSMEGSRNNKRVFRTDDAGVDAWRLVLPTSPPPYSWSCRSADDAKDFCRPAQSDNINPTMTEYPTP